MKKYPGWKDNINKDNINPDHYKDGDIECIDAMEACSTKEQFIGYLRLNAMKYLWRYGKKGDPREQINKAQWYLDRLTTTLNESNVEPYQFENGDKYGN